MRSFQFVLLAALALCVMLPAPAAAQECPAGVSATTISCGDVISATTVGTGADIDDYSCTGWLETGPEIVYVLTLAADLDVTITAAPIAGWDIELYLLPDASGTCDPDACIDDSTGSGTEQIVAPLTAGTYYIVVDGYSGDEGEFNLSVVCESCTDGDSDGYNAYDPVNCPSGDDCDDTDGSINPGVADPCGDSLDLDCDGFDCPDFCLPAATIACGAAAVAGDTTAAGSTPNFYNTYPGCYSGTSYNGREYVYTLTLAQDYSSLTVIVAPAANFDAAIVLLREQGNGCLNTDCVGDQDGPGPGGTETLALADLTAGTYYVVVDGYGSGLSNSGAYDITILCENCTDGDADNYNVFDPVNCPSGDDCDDADASINPGATEICGDGIDQDCSGADRSCCVDVDLDGYEDTACGGDDCNDTDAAINPGALEICEDTIDQNCDGSDDTCPACAADATVDCDGTGTIDTATQGANNWIDYCGAGYDEWTGTEYIWSHTAATAGPVLFSTVNDIDIDISVLADYGNDVCNPGACFATSWWVGDVDEAAGTWLQAGQTVFFAVDLWTGEPDGTYDYLFSCLDEVCAADAVLTCGDDLSATNTAADNTLTLYQGWSPSMRAKDVIYSFATAIDAVITVDLSSASRLGLLVLEDTGSGCDPINAIAASDNPSSGAPNEQVTFQAAAGATYYVVVDGRLPNFEGAYDLAIDCDLDCGASTQCGYACVDTQTNPAHCGACSAACSLAHATAGCAAGSCTVVACDANWGNCDGTAANGCEVDHLNDPNYCGNCNTACSGLTPYCVNGACTDQCPVGTTNCSGICIDLTSNANHCGACGVPCDLANTNAHACVASTCTVVSCDAGFSDCDNADANGCEITLGTLSNCSACADACAFDNAGAACTAGACQMGACDDSYADCNTDTSDGCETALGTIDNCGACADACAYDNAAAECNAGACRMSTCDSNYGDCDQSDANGCETLLNSHSDCGDCGAACNALQTCTGDAVAGYSCSDDCIDADDDGFAAVACGGPDCNDSSAAVHPGAAEACNDVDDDCDGAIDEGFDTDGDGYKSCGAESDCDDTDSSIHPGAAEICEDGIDGNCNGNQDESCACVDADHDGFTDRACGGDDCNDTDPTSYPGAHEKCDQIDNNCDGVIDEDDTCKAGGEGCGCSAGAQGSGGGLLLLGLILGLALLRRRED